MSKQVLWAIHIPGPDDIWGMPDNDAANDYARRHNAFVDSRDFPVPEMRETSYAKVIIWPYDKRSHTASVAEWMEMTGDRK